MRKTKNDPQIPRVYISGPMSLGETLSASETKKNFKAFYEAERELKRQGYIVVNPARNRTCDGWSNYMRKDIAKLVKCHLIYHLRGWKKSRGARFENYVAQELGIDVMNEDL